MSTAFRNFIITFALAAALFAVVSYVAVTGVLSGIFSGETEASGDTSEYSYENAESYYDGELTSGESGEEIPTSKDFGDAYVIFYEDHQDNLCGMKLICANEETGKIVFDQIPVSSTLSVNGLNRTLKEVYVSKGEEYLCNKLQYILGVTIKGYMIFDTESMNKFFTETEICKEYELQIGCNLPYEVKYEDPEMKEYNEQNPDDIQYKVIIGDVVITSENAESIFNNIPEDTYDSQAATDMFVQIYNNVFNSLFSNEKIKNSESSTSAFFKCLGKCTVKDADYVDMFGIFDGLHEVKTFPELSGSAGRELNWSVLPMVLESLMK